MKCEFCGANIDIESDICPHCGLKKSQFEKHREDMHAFQTDYNNLKTGVVAENKTFSQKAAFLTVIAFLVILNLVLILCHAMNYEIYRFFTEKNLKNHISEHVQALSEFESENDYESLYQYYDAHQLNYISQEPSMKEYSLLNNMCIQYNSFMTYFPLVAFIDYSNHNSVDEQFEQYADLTVSSYDRIMEMNEKYIMNEDRGNLYSESSYSDKHMQSYENIISNIDTFIQTYCKFSDEEMETFKSETKAGRIVMLEKAYEKEANLYDENE